MFRKQQSSPPSGDSILSVCSSAVCLGNVVNVDVPSGAEHSVSLGSALWQVLHLSMATALTRFPDQGPRAAWVYRYNRKCLECNLTACWSVIKTSRFSFQGCRQLSSRLLSRLELVSENSQDFVSEFILAAGSGASTFRLPLVWFFCFCSFVDYFLLFVSSSFS